MSMRVPRKGKFLICSAAGVFPKIAIFHGVGLVGLPTTYFKTACKASLIWVYFFLISVIFFVISNFILVPICYLWVFKEMNRGKLQSYLRKHFISKFKHTEMMCALRCKHVIANMYIPTRLPAWTNGRNLALSIQSCTAVIFFGILSCYHSSTTNSPESAI